MKKLMKIITPTIMCTTSFFLSRNIMLARSLSININRNYFNSMLLGHNFNRYSSIDISRTRRNKQQILRNNDIFTNPKITRNYMNTIYLCKNEELDTSHVINDSNENEKSNIHDNENNDDNINNIAIDDISKRRTGKSIEIIDKSESKPLPRKKINYKKVKIEAKQKTKDWVEHIVVAFSLCPFASKPVKDKSLKIVVNFSTDEKQIGLFIIEEMVKLLDDKNNNADDADSKKTSTLIVAPYFYPDDFFSFMSFVSFFDAEFLADDEDDDDDDKEDDDNDKEEEVKLGNCFQVLPFHPQFEFQDSATSSGVDNYTNRSPYPTFHILREDEVSHAVKLLGGDSSKIWDRNVKLMKAFEDRLGIDGVKKIMSVDEEVSDEELSLNVVDVLNKNPPFSWGRKKGRKKRR